jgi:hypothetical protein
LSAFVGFCELLQRGASGAAAGDPQRTAEIKQTNRHLVVNETGEKGS